MKLHAVAAGLFLAVPAISLAAPIVAIDADPTQAGVQASRTVTEGSSFEVDLVVSDVSASSPVQSFQIELGVSSDAVTPLDALDGAFLEAPVLTLQEILTPSSVRFAQISADPTGASGGGVLARFLFEATAPGDAALTLPTVLLSAPFGTPIFVGEIRGANVAVAAVPEPTGALLFAVALIAARAAAMRR
ncbi:MAG TPA: cohesin domain-containing protein [Myxococcota bacterium]|nr:cohesin domain-containing protein [Myxococcota bacterium]